jgi:hypothetical protein
MAPGLIPVAQAGVSSEVARVGELLLLDQKYSPAGVQATSPLPAWVKDFAG